MTIDARSTTNEPRSRRAILAGALTGLAGLIAGRAGTPDLTKAASGDPLIIGSTTNNAGTGNTTLTTSSTGTGLLITQNGTGTALRGSAVGPGSIAGFFTANNGTGVSGVTGNGNSYGVFAQNNGAAGTAGALRASGGNNHGLVATTAYSGASAIIGNSSASSGVAILAINSSPANESTQSAGIRALSGGGTVADIHPGEFHGAAGEFAGRIGVIGATATNNIGVVGLGGATGWGVLGRSTSAIGVLATTSTGIALHAEGDASITGNLVVGGDLDVTGNLSKGGGTFKIDHPLDPANKVLYHSFVESPDMMNIYNGVATLDGKGEATVALPKWFERLNTDFRYQLTAIGPTDRVLYVKSKVKGNAFSIGGGSAGQEVSWQLTGIRQDAWANAHRVVVEEAKPKGQKGKYLHPKEHGQPEAKGIDYAERKAIEAKLQKK